MACSMEISYQSSKKNHQRSHRIRLTLSRHVPEQKKHCLWFHIPMSSNPVPENPLPAFLLSALWVVWYHPCRYLQYWKRVRVLHKKLIVLWKDHIRRGRYPKCTALDSNPMQRLHTIKTLTRYCSLCLTTLPALFPKAPSRPPLITLPLFEPLCSRINSSPSPSWSHFIYEGLTLTIASWSKAGTWVLRVRSTNKGNNIFLRDIGGKMKTNRNECPYAYPDHSPSSLPPISPSSHSLSAGLILAMSNFHSQLQLTQGTLSLQPIPKDPNMW